MHQPQTLTSRPSRTWALTIALCLVPTAMLALPAVSSAETCPNADFRTGPSLALPDCRAYELVTPPYKEGYEVYARAASTDGESVLGESLGNFAGTGDSLFSTGIGGSSLSSLGSDYVFTRGGSGWATTAIEPPASQYPLSALAALSADFGASLWFVATPSQVAVAPQPRLAQGSFIVRRGGGPVVEVGPVSPPSQAPANVTDGAWSFAAASSDLSHVLFTAASFRWPGDVTQSGANSLYEYAGTGNTVPLLVGVSGGAGSTSLISRCGTEPGAGDAAAKLMGTNLAKQHVVSASGTTVFFTAKACGSSLSVDELFARVDNGQPDAHTAAISEPTKEDCERCDTEPGVLSNALFLAASEDGSKVFFSTSQPLLGGDLSNNIYEYDFDAPAGHRIVRVSGGDATVSGPTANVLPKEEVYLQGNRGVEDVSGDGAHVYFAAAGVLTTTPNSQGQTAQPGADNLYVFDTETGTTAFIATATSPPFDAGLSGDGRFLVFTSATDLTPDDSSTIPQAFEYDSLSGALVRVSIGQDGYNGDGNSSNPLDAPHKVLVADDGAAFFESGDGLTPQAINNDLIVLEGQFSRSENLILNVYEYRAGNVYLISDGHDTSGTVSLEFIDPSGMNVFFDTQDSIAPQDGDTQVDTYDARVDGGFPAPVTPPPCVTDACQGGLSAAPVLLSPGSEFQAGGDPPLAAPTPTTKPKPNPCKRGTTLKRGRCVKRKAAKVTAKKRRAGR